MKTKKQYLFECQECGTRYKTPRDECRNCGGSDIDLWTGDATWYDDPKNEALVKELEEMSDDDD